MVARYDRAMQSSRRVALLSALGPEELDLPIRRSMPELARGASRPREARDHDRPRGALVPAVPIRRLQRPPSARRADPRREAVGPRACRGHPDRARVRATPAARDRPADRYHRERGGDLVRSPVRRAPAAGRRRGDHLRQGHASAAGAPQFTSPEFSPVGRESVHTARVVPVYHLTAGVTQKRLRELLARHHGSSPPGVLDPLADAERGGLPALDDALRTAHFPEEAADVTEALDRLAFDELLALQLTLAQARHAREGLRAPSIQVTDAEHDEIIGALPFTLTNDQAAAVAEVHDDIGTERPMRRLLQGDVGSGKTAVAAVALACAVRAGWQGALMAPTEILARQHHAGLAPLLDRLGVRAEFLSGSLPAARKRAIHDAIGGGQAEVVIGTHAVISEAVSFPRLALVIVDEQHRFGVGQRAALQAKGSGGEPHVLALTATPIPRTLALTVYGDLSISTIRELPPGREPIRTEIRDRRALPKIEAFLAAEAGEGRQSFVVVPLVTESEALEAASAEAEAERLRASLPGLRIGIVHGQQRADLRDRDDDGVRGRRDGHPGGHDRDRGRHRRAERERHRHRGRGALRARAAPPAARPRRPRPAPLLLHPAVGQRPTSWRMRRLEVVRGSNDGFAIAEADLELRGAGNLLGTRQSGLPPLRVASLFEPRHIELAQRARVLADAVVGDDPALAKRPLLARLRRDFAPAEEEGDAA